MQAEHKKWERQAQATARSVAQSICGECDGIKVGSFSQSFAGYADVGDRFGPLWPIGGVELLGEGSCSVTADCGTKRFGFSCRISARIGEEKFEDPADIWNLFEGKWEVPGGTPYRIAASWRTAVSGGGSF